MAGKRRRKVRKIRHEDKENRKKKKESERVLLIPRCSFDHPLCFPRGGRFVKKFLTV